MDSGPLADRDWGPVETTYLSRSDQSYCVLDDLLTSQELEELRVKLLNDHAWHFKHPLSKAAWSSFTTGPTCIACQPPSSPTRTATRQSPSTSTSRLMSSIFVRGRVV